MSHSLCGPRPQKRRRKLTNRRCGGSWTRGPSTTDTRWQRSWATTGTLRRWPNQAVARSSCGDGTVRAAALPSDEDGQGRAERHLARGGRPKHGCGTGPTARAAGYYRAFREPARSLNGLSMIGRRDLSRAVGYGNSPRTSVASATRLTARIMAPARGGT
jgi:hypothetical protein